MFRSINSIHATLVKQIGKLVLPNYQPCCLNSSNSLQSNDESREKKAIPPDYAERNKDNDPNDSLLLSLSTKLAFNIDTLAFLHQIPSLKWSNIKEWKKRSKEEKEVIDQRFIFERLQILGSDLAAAHFIVYRGGAVKFKGQNDWIRKNEDGEYKLPSKFVPNLYLEAIDASQTGLLYEGFQNLEHLYYMKSLNLSHCDQIDDWCLDRLHVFKETLEHLDISGCPNVTERGLSCLYRLRHLKTLKLANMPNVSHIQLVSLLLEDALPQCQVLGVDYSNVEIQEGNITDKKYCSEKKQEFQS